MQKRATVSVWPYKTKNVRKSGVHNLTQRRRQDDTEGGEREVGSGAWGRAQQEAFAVLLDLGLDEQVQVGDHGGLGGAGAAGGRCEAVLRFLLQNERKEQQATWSRIVSLSL